jgi:hypothetical protein
MAFGNQDTPVSNGSQTFKEFQISADIKSKRELSYGLVVSQAIEAQMSGTTSYFYLRNARFSTNRRWASGRIDVQAMFQDWLEMNGKTNYVNLKWSCLMLVNTIISKMVGRWMGQNEKIVCTAVDTLSTKQKIEEYQQAEFVMHHREMLEQLQQQSGVPMIPANQYVPEDKEQLDLWQSQFQRLPEEILYELGINDVNQANGLTDIIKEKLLHDNAETGFVGTYTWMDSNGVIHVEDVEPENAIYSYSRFPDFRDTTYRGRVISMKISVLRSKYSVAAGGKLTEEQIWEIAQTAKEYQLTDKISWLVEWNVSIFRPYDEWNVDCIEFEYKSLDIDPYVLVQTKKNKSTLVKPGMPVKALDENEEYVEDKNWNIYRGVYARASKVMLEWGIKKNMIRPQDPTKLGDADFSFSFYMYQMRDMKNLAIPQKIEEPVQQMILCRLKMQQLTAKMRPTGAAINWDALQEIDYGLGDENKKIDPKKHFDQTGDIYYRGRDAEGNPIPIPITELANSGFVGQLQGLIELYQHHYSVLKNELGEDPDAIMQGARPRVAAQNVQAASVDAENASSYIYDGFLYVMEETARKEGCLLKNSVTYGSSAYRHLLKEEDVEGRVFTMRMQMLPTEQEIAKLEAMMNEAIQSNPDFVLYCDTFKILRIAKEDIKLAEAYFRQDMKKMIQAKQQESAQNSQQQADAATQAQQQKSQADFQHMQMELQLKAQTEQAASNNRKEEILLNGVMQIMAKGLEVKPEWQGVVNEMIANVALPLFAKNQLAGNAIAGAMQQGQPDEGDQPVDQGQQPDQSQMQQQQPQPQQQAA